MNLVPVEIVYFRDLSPGVILRGISGEAFVDRVESVYVLRGAFQLVIAGQASPVDSLIFDGRIGLSPQVVREHDQWVVDRMRRVQVTFDDLLDFQPNSPGPWLRALTAEVYQTVNSPPSVRLVDPDISLIPNAEYRGSGNFYYPRSAGVMGVAKLRPIIRRDIAGFYIEYEGENLVMAFGGVLPPVGHEKTDIDNVPGVTVSIFPEGVASFRCARRGETAPPLKLDAQGATRGIRLTVTDGTQLRLDEPPIQPARNESWLQADVVVAGSGWLSAVKFRRQELIVARLEDPVNPGIPSATRLHGPSSRFSYHHPLVRVGQEGWEAQFVYRDSTVFQPYDPENASRKDRYYGLRIRGLGSSAGGQAKLDASVARVALIDAPAAHDSRDYGRVFAFQGGGDITIAGVLEKSLLLPKPNRSDNWKRSFEVPANQMSLRVAVAGVTHDMRSPILLDTALADLQLKVMAPKLVGRPAGTKSAKANNRSRLRPELQDNFSFVRWSLSLEVDQPSLNFRVRDGQVYPVTLRDGQEVEWTRVFRTDPAEPFPLAEYPGAKLKLDPDELETRLRAPEKTEVSYSDEWHPAEGKTLMVYAGISAVLIYKAIDCIGSLFDSCMPDTSIKVKDVNLETPSDSNPAKRNGLNDLQLVYYNNDGGIARFVENNARRAGDTERILWPFAAGLSLVMWERNGNRYAPAIARARKRGAKPGLAVDWSDIEAIELSNFGWTEADIVDAARLDPSIWPRKNRVTGARLDPTDRFWRGILLRDLPLTLPLPPAALQELEKLPLLKSIFDTLNGALMLDYGWKDESGTTWKGGVVFSPPKEIVPDLWTSVISITINQFLTTGFESDFISAEGTVRVKFPRILVDDNGVRPMSITGKVSFDFDGGKPSMRIVIESSQGFLRTTSIPGFDKIKLVRFFTDFVTAQGDLELLPSPALAAAIPLFTEGKPLRATISYNFSGPPAVELSFILPEKEHTNLFRKWDIRIKGMKMRFEDDGLNRVEMTCELVLGEGSFGFVALDIVLRKTADDDWTADVRPREIAGRLEVGDFRLSGILSWTDENQNGGPVSSGDLAQAGQDRDFWALLDVRGGALFGNREIRMWVRFGNRGGQTFWAGGVNLSDLPLGIAKLAPMMLILSRNADFFSPDLPNPNGTNGGFVIERVLDDLGTDVLKLLRPVPGTERTWLTRWQPRPDIGSMVLGSGYLSFDDDIFSSPESGDTNNEHLTTLIYTNRGFVRIEAAVNLLRTYVARFGIAIRPPTGFGASLVLPTLKYPTEDQPDFEFSGGQIILEVDYGSKKRFELSMGWPPLTGANPNDELERDWSKSLMVRWDNVIPINTFWGGFRAEYREGVELSKRRNLIALGVALRAGWTKSYELGGDATGGQAELGIAVGGLVEFQYTYGILGPLSASPNLAHVDSMRAVRSLISLARSSGSVSSPDDIYRLEAARRRIEVALETINRFGEAIVGATLFADVWGKGSAKVLDVDVASLKIEGRARIHLEGSSSCRPMINHVYAYLGFDVEVKIGCKTVTAHGRVDFVFIDRPCNSAFPARIPQHARALPGPGKLHTFGVGNE